MLGPYWRKQQLVRSARHALGAISATTVGSGSGGAPKYDIRPFSADATYDYEPDYSKKHDIVRKHGVDVLHDPLYNKVGGSSACRTMVRVLHGRCTQCKIRVEL